MEKELETAKKTAKISRRTAKAALTRSGKLVNNLIEGKRPKHEVREMLDKLQNSFNELVIKHEAYTALIDDDHEFEEEETWLGECQENFMETEYRAKIYLDMCDEGKGKIEIDGKGVSSKETIHVAGSEGISAMHATSTPLHSTNKESDSDIIQITSVPSDPTSSSVDDINQNTPGTSGTKQNSTGDIIQTSNPTIPKGGVTQGNNDSANNTQTVMQTTGTNGMQAKNATGGQLSCNFKLEKPKLPKFTGDVREYAIFRSDWKHIVDTRYAERDAITLLRANLSDKPLELIKGIGTDYDAAWEYLDAIYGDPRYVSDSVTQDISKFKPLQDGEDSRFCDLVHLVRRSYNTLKEVGVPGDMDNSHMLAIIERKMGPDDRKVWSRDLEREGKPGTLHGLLSWMTAEMKSRMRATAPVRSGSSQRSINQFKTEEDSREKHKCWICKVSTHWPDQCRKFQSLSIDDRLKTVKDNHACFSCLKRAGRNHRESNCSRRKKCVKSENGQECQAYHHPLLHKTAAVGVAATAALDSVGVILPVLTATLQGQDGMQNKGTFYWTPEHRSA